LPSRSAPSIRPAEPRDAAAIARIHIRTWQIAYRGQLPDAFLDALDTEIEERTSRWQGFIAGAQARGWVQLVTEDEDQVVGFVTFGPSEEKTDDARIGEVYAIYVDPSHWDRGHGRALFTAAMRGLTETGFSAATLWVLETNARARRFYESAGWSADGATKTDHRGDIELREVRYRRALTPTRPS
jgi:ribosomal protein S18 acetylase RimI-like enzyme